MENQNNTESPRECNKVLDKKVTTESVAAIISVAAQRKASEEKKVFVVGKCEKPPVILYHLGLSKYMFNRLRIEMFKMNSAVDANSIQSLILKINSFIEVLVDDGGSGGATNLNQHFEQDIVDSIVSLDEKSMKLESVIETLKRGTEDLKKDLINQKEFYDKYIETLTKSSAEAVKNLKKQLKSKKK